MPTGVVLGISDLCCVHVLFDSLNSFSSYSIVCFIVRQNISNVILSHIPAVKPSKIQSPC